MRNLFVSTACLPDNKNYIEVVDRYQLQGITQIELGSSHTYYPENDPQRLENCQAEFLVHNYFPPTPEEFVLNLASSNEYVRSQSINLAKRAIKLCADLKAPFYSVHAGFITEPVGFGGSSYIFSLPQSEAEVDAAWDNFVLSLSLLIDHAQSFGINILIENNVCTPDLKGKLLLQKPLEFIELFDRLNAPNNLGILLDFGHLNVTAHTFGFDRLEFIDKLRSRIQAFHIHNNDGLADHHRPVQQDSWVYETLIRREFINLPMVIEAKFEAMSDLKNHLKWLESGLKEFTNDYKG